MPVDSIASPYFREEHLAFRAGVREFFAAEVLPFIDAWEREGRIPREIWCKLGRAGLLGLNYRAPHGDGERDIFYGIAFLEELGRLGYAGFRGAISVHAFMASEYVARYGSATLQQSLLLPAIAGNMLMALAITEPEGGSDIKGIRTHARLASDDDDLIVSGTKAFITNGTMADILITAVRTALGAPGGGGGALTLLAIDAKAPGIVRTAIDNIGWHCADVARIDFHDVRVPATRVVGKIGHGFFYLMQALQLERLAAATLALGGMDGCMDAACEYLAQRKIFGNAVDTFQAVRHRLADLFTEIEATRALVYHAAWLYDHGELPVTSCSMAKLKATELASRVARECLQLHGAHGYAYDATMSRVYRDVPVGTVAGGTSETMRELIAQLMLDERPSRR